MLGKRKRRQENIFGPARRETRISKELGEVKEILDFEWFRQECKDKFSDTNGRPSIAPEVLGAIIFLGFWYNITSDRELCEECEDRLSFREFIGISDEDEVPVHSSLTHWRQRLGREVFQKFLTETIKIAKKAGLRPGRCRLFDSSLVKAQADLTGPSTIKLDPIEHTNDYLDALGEWEDEPLPGGSDDEEAGKKGGSGWKLKEAKRKIREGVKIQVNAHDVDAKVLSKPNQKVDFYHKCHFSFDASSGLVMNADAGHVPDAIKMVEFLASPEEPVDTVGGDCGYFTIESQKWLKRKGITSLISVHDKSNNAGRAFGIDAFSYDRSNDEYICPAGHVLRRSGTAASGKKIYRTGKNKCTGCKLCQYCFRAGEGGNHRSLTVNIDRGVVEDAISRNRSWRYMRIKTRRSIVCEGNISTMKHYGGLGRARGIGEESMAIQAKMAAAINNLKKVLKFVRRQGHVGMNDLMTACGYIRSAIRFIFGHATSGKQKTAEILLLAA